MELYYEWDEMKRKENIKKHKLDFRDAHLIYEHPLKLTVDSPKGREDRKKDIAPVGDSILVLTLVYVERYPGVRIISFRYASRKERRFYNEHINIS